MATTPVSIKQSAPAPASMPDVWRPFRSEMDRLFDLFTSGFGMMPFASARLDSSVRVAAPAVDITESESEFKLSAELPGLSEKDISVSVSGDTLAIKGEKRKEREEKTKSYWLTERSYGEFQRSFVLPDGVDREKVAAAFANGVLTVTLPKAVKTPARQIEVKAAA